MEIDIWAPRRRRPTVFWTLGAFTLLTACGGGGDGGGEDLYLDFYYGNASFSLLEFNSYAPSFSNLQGHTPRCKLTSGSLPPGITLQSEGCRVVGIPTEAGSWGGTVTLTVDGYEGSLSSEAVFTVPKPYVWAYGAGELTVPWGEPFNLSPVVEAGDVPRRVDDQVSFSLAAPLPAGVVFDAATGSLSGTTTVTPSFNLVVKATISRGPLSFTTAETVIPVSVVQSSFSYKQCCDFVWAVPFQAVPSRTTPTEATISYAVDSGENLPPGITLDPATGTISGVPTEFEPTSPHFWGSHITRTTTEPGGRQFTTSTTLFPSFKKPIIFYDGPSPHLKANQYFSLGAPKKLNFLPDDVLTSLSLETDLTPSYPAPSWLNINTTTGEISAIPPLSSSSSMHHYRVRYTVIRNGMTLDGSTFLSFYID